MYPRLTDSATGYACEEYEQPKERYEDEDEDKDEDKDKEAPFSVRTQIDSPPCSPNCPAQL
jgi:hypothetical protein